MKVKAVKVKIPNIKKKGVNEAYHFFEDDLQLIAYHLYTFDWINSHISIERQLKAFREFHLEMKAYGKKYSLKYTFDDFIEDYGYDGEHYATMNEFIKNEYRDKEYMKRLLGSDTLLWKSYLNTAPKTTYPDLTLETSALILKALEKAVEREHKVYFKVYNEWDREDGNPSYETILPHSEFWNAYFGDVEDINHPDFVGDGCTELCVEDTDEEICLWYSDSDENWVFTKAIEEYLAD